MSVQTQASYARATAVGKAEQMVRNAGGTLGGFPVAQRVGAGRESLVVAERLLVAALEQIRTVQADLELAQADEQDEPAASASVGPVVPAELVALATAGRVVTPLTLHLSQHTRGPGAGR